MTLVKICGVRDPETALLAAAAGADMIGLVFYPKSPRYVTVEQARIVVQALREAGAATKMIGLTVNMPAEEIVRLVREVGLDGVQLSGDETPEQVAGVAESLRAAGLNLMILLKSLRLKPEQSSKDALRLVDNYFDAAPYTKILLDTYRPDFYGGTGDVGDWHRARNVAEEYQIILAGGLTPRNVATAIQQIHPYGVDVSSGVESAPGVKDADLIKQFVHAAKEASEVKRLALPPELAHFFETTYADEDGRLHYAVYSLPAGTNDHNLMTASVFAIEDSLMGLEMGIEYAPTNRRSYSSNFKQIDVKTFVQEYRKAFDILPPYNQHSLSKSEVNSLFDLVNETLFGQMTDSNVSVYRWETSFLPFFDYDTAFWTVYSRSRNSLSVIYGTNTD